MLLKNESRFFGNDYDEETGEYVLYDESTGEEIMRTKNSGLVELYKSNPNYNPKLPIASDDFEGDE